MNGHNCLYSPGVQPIGSSGKGFHPSCETKPVLPRKFLEQCSSSSNAIAMITNSAIRGWCTEKPSWYEKFDLRQVRMLRGGQLNAVFFASDKSCFFVTTMETMIFQDDLNSILVDSSIDHFL